MNNTEAEPRSPSRVVIPRESSYRVPFASEAHYKECMADVTKYRTYLTEVAQHHPELFPQALAQGYWFHARYHVRKPDVSLRRIKLKATGAVFTLRPSFLLPYGIGRTAEVENALFLRQWGVPFAVPGVGLWTQCDVLVSGLAELLGGRIWWARRSSTRPRCRKLW